nr:carboxypeptidase-like regulatory domain-containing protein [Chryseolinea sp.]
MGQSNFSIRGKVVDEDGAIVPFASAALYTKQDTTLVTGGVSNDEGKFEINASPGNYFLKVTFLSYQDKIISPLTVTNKDIDLGSITLQTGSQVLESVTVEGERNQMTLQLDKRIFQVGKDLSNISGSAADILDNVP